MKSGISKKLKYVVLIDDEEDTLDYLEALCELASSLEIVSFQSGLNALNFISENQKNIELVLCDLDMPEIDGIDMLKQLGLINYNGRISIISARSNKVIAPLRELALKQQFSYFNFIEKRNLNIGVLRSLLVEPFTDEKGKKNDIVVDKEFVVNALSNSQVDVKYQPKVDMKTGEITSIEALTRCSHPVFGQVDTAVFVDVAERYNLINELTWKVVKQSTLDLKSWKKRGFKFKLAINLSTHSLKDTIFLKKVERYIKDQGINPSNIIIEVTESQDPGEDVIVYFENITRMYLMGFSFSMDDYGTGFSSLEQLSKLPFQELKIDQYFVKGIMEEKEFFSIVENTIQLGKKLGLKVVAEGVENQNTINLLSQLGCDEVQGFYISKPLSKGDFDSWLIGSHLSAKNKKLSL